MKYEYAVEIHNANDFQMQIGVYQNYSDALEVTINHRDELNENDYFVILEIEYDDNENEMGITLVYDESIYELENLKETLLNSIAEFEGYLKEDGYDDLEKHDCRIIIEAYKGVVRDIEKAQRKEV